MVVNNELAHSIQNLCTKAFVLEALTDKPGCTTRYIDLPGKPLSDFVVAGINSAPYLQLLADDLQTESNVPIFKHLVVALQASNQHKSQKIVNFGLLEIMFPAVYARLSQPNSDKIIDTLLQKVHNSTNQDVHFMLEARRVGFQSSAKDHKKYFPTDQYTAVPSVAAFYIRMMQDYGPNTSHYQWAEHYNNGLPILRAFFEAYQANREVMQTTKEVFLRTRQKYPDIKIGIIADMCAAAIFLWLSYSDQSVESASNL